jgi:hypothetical protein
MVSGPIDRQSRVTDRAIDMPAFPATIVLSLTFGIPMRRTLSLVSADRP